VSQPPLPLTHYCIDPQLAGVLIANMLESWLSADSALAPTREAVDEHDRTCCLTLSTREVGLQPT
jgi:hypothetical protein